MNLRTDMHVMRNIHEQVSPEALRHWKRIPFVIAPEDGFPEYLLINIRKKPGETGHPKGLTQLVPSIEHIPWDEFVLDLTGVLTSFAAAISDTDRPAIPPVIVRILTVTAAEKHAHLFPWLPEQAKRMRRVLSLPRSTDYEPSLAFIDDYCDPVTWKHRSDTGRWQPNLFICDLRQPWVETKTILLNGSEEDNRQADVETGGVSIVKMVPYVTLQFLAYLSLCDEHFIQRKDTIPAARAAKTAKTADLKPWLDERLPQIILIDPNRVNEFRDGRPTAGGTHASPRPHQRRGHWKTLSAERFKEARGKRLWIKPTWVGDTEWECDGQVYKVLPAGHQSPRATTSAPSEKKGLP